ncbi:MarR family winged helix-turn-helix transcriptional regulator [Propionibacteriaceae bacterium G57]|uniref:MarR family winged helix-turn-helix transcriptional regulator n=1 Tax=Aestuariimicrobium sp. G57 TaxID=3418485 RepID=UPI003DA6E326
MSTSDLATALITATARFNRLVRQRAGQFSDTIDTPSLPVWRALAIFDEHQPLRVTDFAAIDLVSQPTATALLRRMGADGLIARRPDPDDGRASLLELTDAGREALHQHRRRGSEVVTPLLSDLTPGQLAILAEATTILTALMDDHA